MMIITLNLSIIAIFLFHHIFAPTLTLSKYAFMFRLGTALLHNTNGTRPPIIFAFASITKATCHAAFFANLFAFLTPKTYVARCDFGVTFWVVESPTVVEAGRSL